MLKAMDGTGSAPAWAHPRLIAALVAGCAAILAAACSTGGGAPSGAPGSLAPTTEASPVTTPKPASGEVGPFEISSTAFAGGAAIPARYTCRGQDVSPDLSWTGAPADAAALVLLVDDPDGGDWVHWTVLDLSPETGGLAEGVSPSADPPQQGVNDFGRVGYGGPCPPSGTHRYVFTLYALGSPISLSGHPDGATVRRALDAATVLDRATLQGTFSA
jgi:Raf kinase inhibitor-like YbhB/YbcL family protein